MKQQFKILALSSMIMLFSIDAIAGGLTLGGVNTSFFKTLYDWILNILIVISTIALLLTLMQRIWQFQLPSFLENNVSILIGIVVLVWFLRLVPQIFGRSGVGAFL